MKDTMYGDENNVADIQSVVLHSVSEKNLLHIRPIAIERSLRKCVGIYQHFTPLKMGNLVVKVL